MRKYNTRPKVIYRIKISEYCLLLENRKLKRFLCEIDDGTIIRTFNEDKLDAIFKRIKERDW